MPPRRTRQLKSLKGRVERLVTRSEYDKLLAKSSKRLVVVHYFTSTSPAQQLQNIRAHLNKVSKQRELSNVLFAEVDVSQPGFEGLAAEHGVTTLPAFHLWKGGVAIEVLTGMSLGAVAQKCIEHAGKNSAEPASRWKRALIAALAFGTVAAAGYFGYQQSRNGHKTMSSAAQIEDLDAKIKEVKTRLAYVTRRKLHKAKREQQKKLKALEERRQSLVLGQKQSKSVLKHHADSDDSDDDSDSE
ncbi:TPA: hypothetical protein ACH3X2_012978 [Trebouxia sp. C0005]